MSCFEIVIVSYNTCQLLHECLRSLDQQTGPTWRAIVVDNGSIDDSVPMVREHFPATLVIAVNKNLGFAAGVNRGLASASAPYVLLLNSDATLQAGALAALHARLETEPSIGLLAARLFNLDGSPQPSCVPRHFPWTYSSPERSCDLRWASAAALVVRRTCLETIGSLDENFFYTGEDCDWCLRARRAGWRVALEPAAEVIHRGAVTRRQLPKLAAESLHLGRQYFFAKHYGRWGKAYARCHSVVELLGLTLRRPRPERAFYLGLLRRTLAYRPEIERG
ncbi:MAG: glycosyltransferase family 2 protein [Cyanobacteria bacterium NC_groundwater_1444_Ag_S-0.65um_54_12]|nr:glycosyltransferase family 2 protein [Cyanobacteria bacterium NC_groundwater_1444_Ag_S-0.65um_54_12]